VFVLQYLIDISGGLHVLVPYMYEQFINNLTYEVKNGNIPMSQSDDVVAKILQVKFETGLFEHPYANKGFKSFSSQQVITCLHDS
jgi:beta-glucosidase-like glycosyl hydrolase